MSGRPGPAVGPALRVEVLKELQQLIDSREIRDRIDRGPLAETKGREHWVLHLLLKSAEYNQSHFDMLVGSAYSNLVSRMEAIDDRLAREEERAATFRAELTGRFDSLETSVGERLAQGLDAGTTKVVETLTGRMGENLDQKWAPIGDAVETFAQGSKQVLKDVADSYRVATQTRLLLNENARRITDLGRDLVALEESLKLVVAKTIEEALQPLEQRVVRLEGAPTGAPAPLAARAATNGTTGAADE